MEVQPMRRILTTGFVIVALVTACGDDETSDDNAQHVSREEFGSDGRTWPLTIDDATVQCDNGAAILRTPDGEEFSLNGVAISRGVSDISDSDIVVPGDTEGTHLSTGDLTAAAIELCD
jgi:hypothetical protein